MLQTTKSEVVVNQNRGPTSLVSTEGDSNVRSNNGKHESAQTGANSSDISMRLNSSFSGKLDGKATEHETTENHGSPSSLESDHSQAGSQDSGPQRVRSSSTSEPAHPNAKMTSTKQSNGSVTTRQNMSTPICKNCKTQTTPLWRRDQSGQVLCNACGLFLKLHGRPRPISLKSDVIKSRNRVKHNNNGNGSKSSPNTPELKAKDSHNKFSSKQYKPRMRSGKRSSSNGSRNIEHSGSQNQAVKNGQTNSMTSLGKVSGSIPVRNTRSPGLLPLLPRGQSSFGAPNGNGKSSGIQPLHYPASTPTQFAPNLTRVTSPLLLSSTAPPIFNPSQSSERSSSQQNLGRDAVLNAAGALETLSQQNSNEKIPGMKLDGITSNSTNKIETLPPLGYIRKPYSPSTELNGYATPPLLPAGASKLPALSPNFAPTAGTIVNPAFAGQPSQGSPNGEILPPIKSITGGSSPSGSNGSTPSNFGPMQQAQQQIASRSQMASPMISAVAVDGSGRLPSIGRNQMTVDYQQQQQQQRSRQSEQRMSQNVPVQSQQPIQGNQTQAQLSAYATSEELRTRISELELVNDLYKTRIMELEAMDNAAKQREMLLKKRIDELAETLRRRQVYGYPMEYMNQSQPHAQQPRQQRQQTMRSQHGSPAPRSSVLGPQASPQNQDHKQQKVKQESKQQSMPQIRDSPPKNENKRTSQTGGDFKRVKLDR